MMNLSILLTTLALIAAAAHAAECTTSQLQATGQLPELQLLDSACAGVSVGSSTANIKAVCRNTKCLEAMKNVLKAFPKCEVQGVSVSAAIASVDKTCESVGVKSSTSGTSSTSSTTTITTSAASSSSVSATAVAVAAAVFTYTRI